MDSFRQPLCAAEGIRDSGSCTRIFLVSGITHKCPAGSIRSPDVVRNGSSHEMRFTLTATHEFGQVGSMLRNYLPMMMLNIPANSWKVLCRKRHADQCEVVVGVIGKDHSSGPQPEVPSFHAYTAPIRIPGAFQRRACLVFGGAHRLGHDGKHSVRANYDARPFSDLSTIVPPANSNHLVVIPDKVMD